MLQKTTTKTVISDRKLRINQFDRICIVGGFNTNISKHNYNYVSVYIDGIKCLSIVSPQ